MPHLSPLNWAFAFIIFWTILFTISSVLWWQQAPYFTSSEVSGPSVEFSKWDWS